MKFFDAMKIFWYLKDHQSDPQFEVAFEDTDYKELSDKIIKNYLILIKKLGIEHFEKVKFPDYEDPRIILIDDKEYNFDIEFSHNDRAATAALCAIDCFMADSGEDFKAILLTVEKALNDSVRQ